MKTGFVFDLDGTLVDSIPGIARGLNLALKALGYPEHSVDAIREIVYPHPSVSEIIREAAFAVKL